VLSLSGPRCGDGALQGAEVCDDGNTLSETQCPYGQASCTACSATCAATLNLSGPFCGDGATQAGSGEICDDGNTVTELACPYGTASCTACDSGCRQVLALTGPRCGDGALQGAEACDDGNTVTETACAYGVASCLVCSATCTQVPATGGVCGDATTNVPNELCDDGNASACGTCNAVCSVGQPVAAASGSIVTPDGALLADGEVFVLDDGLHAPVIFEFDVGDGVAPSRVAVAITSATLADAVADAITALVGALSPQLNLIATRGAVTGQVLLVNTQPGGFGNHPIFETVANAGFVAAGLGGGGGRDCGLLVGCRTDDDCRAGLTCQGVGARSCQ
jgi:cysteine-rich repeat protein